MEEYVLVFPVYVFEEFGYFQGLSFDIDKYFNIISERKEHKFIKRKDAELNFNYKQIIAYVILKHDHMIFTYRRGKLLAEKRLYGDYSIGVGGHITWYDPNFFDNILEVGIKREINEEIEIDKDYRLNLVAMLNDDSDEVGRVHFGIIYVVDISNEKIKPKEKSINEPRFLSIKELKKNINKFESWSKICIKQIENIISKV